MGLAKNLHCIMKPIPLILSSLLKTVASALKLTLPINPGAVVLLPYEQGRVIGANTAAVAKGEQDEFIFLKSRRFLVPSAISARKRKTVNQDPDPFTVKRGVQQRRELSSNVIIVVSTPKHEDELVAVGSHSRQ